MELCHIHSNHSMIIHMHILPPPCKRSHNHLSFECWNHHILHDSSKFHRHNTERKLTSNQIPLSMWNSLQCSNLTSNHPHSISSHRHSLRFKVLWSHLHIKNDIVIFEDLSHRYMSIQVLDHHMSRSTQGLVQNHILLLAAGYHRRMWLSRHFSLIQS